MPCFLILVILLFPRVALLLTWFYSTYLQRAFHGGLVLPILGFLFLPLTIGRKLHVHPVLSLLVLYLGASVAGATGLVLALPVFGVVAVIVDLGGLGGGAHRQSRRW